MLLSLSLLMAAGLVLGEIGARIGLPRVTGYLLGGALLSESAFGPYVGIASHDSYEALTGVALGIVAYLVGGAVNVGQLKRIGRLVVMTAFGESFTAATLVALGVALLFGPVRGVSPLHLGLVLGAVAATTDPAATVAVSHEYRARGPLTQMLLGVTALDDVFGLLVFVVVVSLGFGESFDVAARAALLEILGALVLGGAIGLILPWADRRVRRVELRVPLVVTAILLVTAAADAAGVSRLLAAMALGFSSRAQRGSGDRLFSSVEHLEELVFLVFFAVAGSQFQAGVLFENAALVFAYVGLRAVGKGIGAALFSKLSRVPAPRLKKGLIGLGLVPQAGVALGLSLSLSALEPIAAASQTLVNVVLASTVINEFVGPMLTRFALTRAGELGERRTRQHEAR